MEKYFDLRLHEFTDPPRSYFTILTGEDIEDCNFRFGEREIELFIKHPKMIKFCKFKEFSNFDFFSKICHIDEKVFPFLKHNYEYPLFVAVYFGYINLIPIISINKTSYFDHLINWETLEEDIAVYLLQRMNVDDPRELYEIILKKGYIKLFDLLFSFNDSWEADISIKIEEKLFQHMAEKYPNYKGFDGKYSIPIYLLYHNNVISGMDKDIIQMIAEKDFELFKEIEPELFMYRKFFDKISHIDKPIFKWYNNIDEEEYVLPVVIAIQNNYTDFILEKNIRNMCEVYLRFRDRYHNEINEEVIVHLLRNSNKINQEIVIMQLFEKYSKRINLEFIFPLIFEYELIDVFEKFRDDIYLNIEWTMSQKFFDHLVQNHSMTTWYSDELSLCSYGVYHKMTNLPELRFEDSVPIAIIIVENPDYEYLEKEVFPNEDLFFALLNSKYVEYDKQQKMQKYYPMFRKVAPEIYKRFAHLHDIRDNYLVDINTFQIIGYGDRDACERAKKIFPNSEYGNNKFEILEKLKIYKIEDNHDEYITSIKYPKGFTKE